MPGVCSLKSCVRWSCTIGSPTPPRCYRTSVSRRWLLVTVNKRGLYLSHSTWTVMWQWMKQFYILHLHYVDVQCFSALPVFTRWESGCDTTVHYLCFNAGMCYINKTRLATLSCGHFQYLQVLHHALCCWYVTPVFLLNSCQWFTVCSFCNSFLSFVYRVFCMSNRKPWL